MSNVNRFTPEQKEEMRRQLAELHKVFYEEPTDSSAGHILAEIKRREEAKKEKP